MEAAEKVVVKRVAEAVVVPLSELVQATVRVVVQGMVVLMGTGMQVVEVEVGVAEEVAAVGELEPPGLDQATVQDMDPVLVTGQEVEAGNVAAAVVVQGVVLLIGMGMQVAGVEILVAETLREVHHPGMDQALVQERAEALGGAPDTDQGAEVGTEAGVVVAKEVGKEEEVESVEEGTEALGPATGVAPDTDQGAGVGTEAGVVVAKEVGEEEEVEAMAVKLVQDPDPDMGAEVDRDMGQERAAERRFYPEVEEMTE